MASVWKKSATKLAERFRIFDLIRERFESPRNGHTVDAVVCVAADWVNIVALTDGGRVVLIRQFRFGSESVELEIPGGMVDPGEQPLAAARRELLEECGYESERWTSLGTSLPNPAFLRNRLHLFLAEGCRKTCEQNLDPGEDIDVEEADLADIDAMLADGRIANSLVAVAFQKLAFARRGLELG